MESISWLDCKTNKPILLNQQKSVFLLVPKEFGGGSIRTNLYLGDGYLGDVSIFAKIAEWNANGRFRPGNESYNHLLGLELSLGNEYNFSLKYPIKITYEKTATYEECEPSLRDQFDGKSKMSESVQTLFSNLSQYIKEQSPDFFDIRLKNENYTPIRSYDDVSEIDFYIFSDKTHMVTEDFMTFKEYIPELEYDEEEYEP